ncbi:MAG TPA: ATP-binding protein, partial [Saprospiraceae bacterium]|nr:ATP-binding protein [Saprospiraceae bacterium]
DIALMDRVIQNLVDNALKFSKQGDTINIEIGQTAETILVTISDTGTGIAEEDLPYIFDRFRIGKNNETSTTGLGLAIVKKIVELHHLMIRVASKENIGTVFTLEIPLNS